MKKNKKQKRHSIIRPSFKQATEIGGFDIQDGIFIFKDSNGNKIIPEYIEIGEYYERESGKNKIISQIKTENNHINLNPHFNNKNYIYTLAIDTNTKEINGFKISISCSVKFVLELGEPVLQKGEYKQNWDMKIMFFDALVFLNSNINPEKIGWQELLNRITQDPSYDKNKKIGIIVDSELGNISQYNKRQQPILGEHFLPENVELIYASSDTNKENPYNKIISICDKTANLLLDYVANNLNILDNLENRHNLFIDGSTIIPSDIVMRISKINAS